MKLTKPKKPPRLAEWILRRLFPDRNGDTSVGDFEEMFHGISEDHGRIPAFIWYWAHLFISIKPLIIGKLFWSGAMLKNYLKIALRRIFKHRVFSLINIMGLAISLAICLLVIKMIISIYSSDRWHEHKDRIYRVNSLVAENNLDFSELAAAPMPLAEELIQIPEVESAVRIKNRFGGEAAYNKKRLQINGYYADNTFFQVFSYELEFGNPSKALVEPNSVVLTQATAERLFGHLNPVGEMVHIEDLGEFRITGVLKAITGLKSHFQFGCLASTSTLVGLEQEKKIRPVLNRWGVSDTYVYLLLRKDASPQSVEAYFGDIVKKHYASHKMTFDFKLQALTDISPGRNMSNQLTMPIPHAMTVVFSSIAFIITLIACFNYTNLSLANSLSRAKEVGIRKVVGANRFKLFTQFIGESIIVTLIALLFAYMILTFFEPWFYSLNPEFQTYLQLENMGLDLFIAFLLFTFFLGILAGVFPALYLSKFKPAPVLKDISKVTVFSRITLRKVLIVFQFFMSFVFIITSLVFYKQNQFHKHLDMGFQTENIVNVELGKVNYVTFKQEISHHTGISVVSASAFLPGMGISWRMKVHGTDPSEAMNINMLPVDEHFIENLGLRVMAGRPFPENSSLGNEKFVIVNETAVQYFGYKTPVEAIGQRLIFEDDFDLEIIGVVKDFISQQPENAISPLALRVRPQDFRYANIRIRNEDLESTLAFINEKWKTLDPNHPMQYQFFEDQLKEVASGGDNIIKLIGFVTFFILMIAFLGLLGMVIYDMETRTKEIGIRKVLGAKESEIVLTISKRFITLLLTAAVLATPAAWFVNNLFLQNFAHRIKLGFNVFLVGFIFMFAICFIIIFSQTIRAARENPAEALKYE